MPALAPVRETGQCAQEQAISCSAQITIHDKPDFPQLGAFQSEFKQ